MFFVKFVVLILTFCKSGCFISNYCDLCDDHVLCKYNRPGKGDSCKGYDKSALLTQDDIHMIINKINNRRNFVALGYAHKPYLPQAANMRKIIWSEELATIAQRWADQCHPDIHPDKTDQCRNLEHMQVGQNIASISGVSPGLTVKSFIDIWFMQSLDYTGSVSYFNRSQDQGTVFFTQLIWGETHLVGCGKSKFYIGNGKIIMERLVCNFAPRGNIDRRPVYLIGFPATQCPEGTTQDSTFSGLCSESIERTTSQENIKTFATPSVINATTRPVIDGSMLRILNLFNNTVFQETDPLKINAKQGRLKIIDPDKKRHQRLKHVLNISNVAVNPVLPQLYNPLSFKNVSRRQEHDHHGQHERGHSHLHHDYSFTQEVPPSAEHFGHRGFDSVLSNDYRRHHHQQQLPPFLEVDFRRQPNVIPQIQQCTRKIIEGPPMMIPPPLPPPLLPPLPPLPPPYVQNTDCFKCTRGEKNCCNPIPVIPSTLEQIPVAKPDCDHQQEQCACFSHPTTCQAVRCCEGSCQCDLKSHCVPVGQGYQHCQHILRRHNDNSMQNKNTKTTDSQYDDNVPSIALRDGNAIRISRYPLSITNYRTDSKPKSTLKSNSNLRTSQDPQDLNFMYDLMHSRRKKRKNFNTNISVKPFWKMEGPDSQHQVQLKSLRYTTLSNPRYKNYKRIKITSTEPITIMSDDEHLQQNNHQHYLKEKFLSFDELMNFRNNRIGDFQKSGRRRHRTGAGLRQATTTKAAATTTAIAATTTAAATTNSTKSKLPRINYCSRKMTCTWTTLIDAKGGIGGGGGGGGGGGPGGGGLGGSRTPPGYVDGCSRTSTCTRDFLERNRVTLSDSEYGSGEDGSGDEYGENGDYCEKRALNVDETDFDDTRDRSVRQQDYEMFTDAPPAMTSKHNFDNENNDQVLHTFKQLNDVITESNYKTTEIPKLTDDGDCLCDTKNSKKKRFANHMFRIHAIDGEKVSKNENTVTPFSYQTIYNTIIEKILNIKRDNLKSCSKNCLCSRINFNGSCS